MIISWSPVGMTKETMYSKFPFVAPGLIGHLFESIIFIILPASDFHYT